MTQTHDSVQASNLALKWLETHAPEFVEDFVKNLIHGLTKQTTVSDLQSNLTDEYGSLFEDIGNIFPFDEIPEGDDKKMLTTRIFKISEINDSIQKMSDASGIIENSQISE